VSVAVVAGRVAVGNDASTPSRLRARSACAASVVIA
jgi:hypothetical protein